jgi:hypothetical protein
MAEDESEDGGPPAADPVAGLLAGALRDQALWRERLGHAREFLSSPLFVDLREPAMTVSDPPEVLAARARDLDHRIAVLRSLLALLEEERALLDRVRPAGAQP